MEPCAAKEYEPALYSREFELSTGPLAEVCGPGPRRSHRYMELVQVAPGDASKAKSISKYICGSNIKQGPENCVGETVVWEIGTPHL